MFTQAQSEFFWSISHKVFVQFSSLGRAIFVFSAKIGLKSAKNRVFCTLFRPLGGLNIFNIFNIFKPQYLPNNFSKYFEKACKISQRSTRSTTQENDLLYIPRFRSNRLQNSFRYQGVKIWNSIPHSIRLLSPISFREKLKKFFVDSYES